MEKGFYHPDRGYWQATDASDAPYTYVIEPAYEREVSPAYEREVSPARDVEDEDGNTIHIPAVMETVPAVIEIVPAVMGETTQLAELLAGYPEGTIEVPLKPGADYDWQDGEWVEVPVVEPVPDRVSANQFGKQLSIMELLGQVQAWVSMQDEATQWSFNRASTFVRTDPMMQTGFAALGFSTQQIDKFFIDAAKLGAGD